METRNMYMKDKNTRLTLRVTPEQMAHINRMCATLGVCPSDYLRMILNVTIAGEKRSINLMKDEVNCRENEIADFNN